MIYLGQITHGFVGKGVPALKKVADKWIMVSIDGKYLSAFYYFIVVGWFV